MIARYSHFALAACLLFAPLSTLAFPESVSANTPMEAASGYEVAKITNPVSCERLSVDVRAFTQMVDGMKASDDLKDLETDYPGITRYMAVAMLPLLNLSIEESMPRLWTDIGAAFDTALNPGERYWLLKLFESGGGQKLLASTCANAQIGGIIDDVMTNDGMIKVETVQKSMDQTRNIAAKEAVGNMTEAEAREFEQLAAKAGFDKFAGIRPEIIAIKTAWMNEDDPKYDAQLDATVNGAIEEFIAASEERRSPKKLPAEN